jgi:hypothetical protein
VKGSSDARMRTRLTVKPGHPGARHLTQIYGERLVCVRFRYDPARGRRIKTVELIVAEVPWEPPGSWQSEALDAASPVRPAASSPSLPPSLPAAPSSSDLGASARTPVLPALGTPQASRPRTPESGERDARARRSIPATFPPRKRHATAACIREVRGERRDEARDEPRDEARDEARYNIREAAADGTDATRQPTSIDGIGHETERLTGPRGRGIRADAWVVVAITWDDYVRLRPRLVASGGRWNPEEQVCEVRYRHAYALGIADLVRGPVPSTTGSSPGGDDEFDRGSDPGIGPGRHTRHTRHTRRPGSDSVAEQCVAYAGVERSAPRIKHRAPKCQTPSAAHPAPPNHKSIYPTADISTYLYDYNRIQRDNRWAALESPWCKQRPLKSNCSLSCARSALFRAPRSSIVGGQEPRPQPGTRRRDNSYSYGIGWSIS